MEPLATSKPRRGLVVVVWTLLGLVGVGALGVFELGLSVVLTHPPSETLFEAARLYYNEWDRSIVQFLPECSRYDSSLTYTLRPGRCRFRNREFDTEIRVNSRGFRSDEQALNAPEVVVVGDSYAMGWGVPQDSTFAALMERRTGLRVLDTGVSSYGTARELMGLRRVDMSSARDLIIQYSFNDQPENEDFVRGNGSLNIRPESAYDSLVEEHLRTARYYPGKHLRRFLPIALRALYFRALTSVTGVAREAPRVDRISRNIDAEVDAFLGTLMRSPVRLDSLRIIVFEVTPFAPSSSGFAERLATESRRPTRPRWMQRIHVLDAAKILTASDYYKVDDHLRSSGHASLATALAALVQANGG
jgi:hypothetical protein